MFNNSCNRLPQEQGVLYKTMYPGAAYTRILDVEGRVSPHGSHIVSKNFFTIKPLVDQRLSQSIPGGTIVHS